MKKIFGAFAGLCFLLLLGTVGGIEQETIGFTGGVCRCILFFGLFGLCTYLAGGFSSAEDGRQKIKRGNTHDREVDT